MYGVYIVDDEKRAVNDLVTSIPWLEHGFEVVGQNTDPKAALSEIVAIKPDVVICDLKMPVWDGNELIKRIKESGITAEYIMLSAYAEFEASREFFLMDGFDYILKPLDRDDAALVLEKLSRKIAAKQNQTPTVRFVPSLSKSFDRLVAYVSENYCEKNTLGELSESFSISQTHICSLFAKHYGSTLTIFVTNLRMEEARKLVSQTDTPLKIVSTLCGYTNYQHFCRVFKGHYGTPPSTYREERALPAEDTGELRHEDA